MGPQSDAILRQMNRAIASSRAEIRRGLTSLAMIVSTAPLLGFLGGCIGIISAFKGCAGEKSWCLAMTAAGLSEAMIPVALGLFVSVPVWWLFRYLSACVDEFEVEMADAALGLLNCLAVQP
jgi:biopolymer transport protein ExbB